jgi:predicted nucleic acid-binding protein
MTRWFADTFYFLALLNPKDARHAAAVQFSRANGKSVVTTEWVLTELADGLARRETRATFVIVHRGLTADGATQVITSSAALWNRGRERYERRPDKDWSLTDCISFVVLEELGLTEALTADHHFEQAGFVALLKP